MEWKESQTRGNEYLDQDLQTKKSKNLPKSGLVELIEHYRCGSLEASVFTSKQFATTGFTVSPELDLKAKEVYLQFFDKYNISHYNFRLTIY